MAPRRSRLAAACTTFSSMMPAPPSPFTSASRASGAAITSANEPNFASSVLASNPNLTGQRTAPAPSSMTGLTIFAIGFAKGYIAGHSLPIRRLVQSLRRQRENLDAGFGHANRMLELRGERAIARHRRPAVGQDLHMRPAEIDHRLDGEEHAGLEHDALAGPADMHDIRLVMEQPA